MIDYATKHYLATAVTSTDRGADALACLRLAVPEAERILGVIADGDALFRLPLQCLCDKRAEAHLHHREVDLGMPTIGTAR